MSSRWMNPVKLTAKQVLFDYKISDSPVAGIPKVLQEEGIELIDVSVDDNSCGMYCVEDDERKIYINRNMGEGRRNFTIAHELGHHFLSHHLNEYCQIYRNMNTLTYGKDPREVEANYFAACFLMPYELIMPLFNTIVSEHGLRQDSALNISDRKQILILKEIIKQVTSVMKVSKEAAFYRLKGLNMIESTNNLSEIYCW